ncbi:18S rRNA (guanine1575-N7)-methyltransferase [Lithohypha guttulata]|uniref:18S rRNA (guanine1575-N7)-methyltransferase n=1 Tax=Lithohypha guttulata TaxID=1690604 RepID=UPI002DE18ABD|nr:18S rRNA (guanine1575-N7)-methyltransferase [Lithohypha guttulata]
MSRPEDLLPPDLFYNDTESAKYTTSSRIRQIQASMTHRALELLDLRQPAFVLDCGCGSGLSGEILSQQGHTWVGVDISPSMLDIALQRQQTRPEQTMRTRNGHTNGNHELNGSDELDDNEDEDDDDDDNDDDEEDQMEEDLTSSTLGPDGDLMLLDLGQGLPFRPGSFDAAISISALQWLCNIESTHNPTQQTAESRLRRFFDTLYVALKRGGKAVIQFYPRNETQRKMISSAAVRAGFGAGLLEDDGGTKNVKYYLVLSVGGGDITGVVRGMDNVDVEDGRAIREARGGLKGTPKKGSKAWVMSKKEKMKAKGKVVKGDSKYTARSRGPKF